MRDLPILIVVVLLAVFALGIFTDMMPPSISQPARGVYNEGARFVNDLGRAIGMGAGSEYFMLLPKR